jgi:hypothetical protein
VTEERRRHPRLAQPLDCVWRGSAGARQCRIADISLGGCFVSVIAQPAVDEETRLDITYGDRAVSLMARVVTVEPGIGFAVSFDGNPPPVLEELGRLIEGLPTGD